MMKIEAMTRRVIIAGGVSEAEFPFVLHAAMHGHAPSRRRIERAIGSRIFVRFQEDDVSLPMDTNPHIRWSDAVLHAKTQISKDFVWDYDQLRGELPNTLRIGIVGRRLRDVVDAECLSPDVITRKGTGGALIDFDPTINEVEEPGLLKRIRWMPRRWRLSLEEGVVEGPKPLWMIAMMGAMTAMLSLMLANNLLWVAEPSWITNTLLTAAIANGLWFIANGVRRRQFSLLAALDAQARHATSLTQ